MQTEDFFLCLGNLVGSLLGAEGYGKNYLGMKKKEGLFWYVLDDWTLICGATLKSPLVPINFIPEYPNLLPLGKKH